MDIWADCTARWVPFSISIYGIIMSEDKIWKRGDDGPAVGISVVVAGVAAEAAGF